MDIDCKEEKQIAEAIVAARKMQEFLWGEYNGQWNIEEWRPEIMYRNAEYGGSDVFDAESVILFEIGELKNTYILEYCTNHYDLSDILLDRMKAVIENVESYEEDTPELVTVVKDLLKEVSRQCKTKVRYCLWLASLENVRELYDGNDDNISAYKTSDVILSDLGDDGMLFGYSEMPKQIN